MNRNEMSIDQVQINKTMHRVLLLLEEGNVLRHEKEMAHHEKESPGRFKFVKRKHRQRHVGTQG